MNRLFVYGTLRPGSTSEHAAALERTAHHIGSARIRGRLFRVTHYPALGASLSPEEWVKGDVFENVTAEMLQQLDSYEGDDYTRQLVEVTMENGQTLSAFVYRWALPTDGLRWIPSGDWMAADSE